jgi:hypothetical protein
MLRGCAWGCGTMAVVLIALIAVLFILLRGSAPKNFPVVKNPLPPPDPGTALGGGLDGFSSPYIGHTGSWDGAGGAMFGGSKEPDLDREVAMGLRWTFMCVYWRKLEPDGPVDLDAGLPRAWRSLDAFVIAAQGRGLNILMQAPVVGGNAGGPPDWAGRRQPGRSAPRNMNALAEFAGKLARRYCPGGTLARQQGWGTSYGVRAWELDNEPESYRTNWKGQAADYAEFATRASAQIKKHDPQALILTPALASGAHAVEWLRGALDAEAGLGSPEYRSRGERYSIGPVTDVVSFHNYEGLDSFFAGEDCTISKAFMRIRGVFEEWEDRSPGHEYSIKEEYWHTEGNFDFIGALSQKRRAAWRFQFYTRAFAAGIRKVTVMDASALEQIAVQTYVSALPDPFPMLPATQDVNVLKGACMAFYHADAGDSGAGRVWVVWALPDTGEAEVEIPMVHAVARILTPDGSEDMVDTVDGKVLLNLPGDSIMPAPVLVIDRPMSRVLE